jgi:hypothetical protein
VHFALASIKKLLYAKATWVIMLAPQGISPMPNSVGKIFWELFNGIKEVRGVYGLCSNDCARSGWLR